MRNSRRTRIVLPALALLASAVFGQEPAAEVAPPQVAPPQVAPPQVAPEVVTATAAVAPAKSETGGPLEGAVVLEARRLRGLRPEIAAQVFAGQAGGAVRLRALGLPAGPSAAGGGAIELRLFVEIDGASLVESVAGGEGDLAALELYAYLLADGGRVAGFLADGFVFSVSALGEAVWQSGLEYFGRLEAPPGRYELRVLVRERRSGASGLVRTAVEAPAAGAPRVLAIFERPTDRDPWVPVRGAGLERDDRGFLLGPPPLVPAALPVLTAGDPARTVLVGPGDGAELAAKKVRVEFGGPSRRHVEAELAVEAGALVARFTPPPRLEPGTYTLVVDLGRDRASRPVEVVVVRPGSGSMRWTDAGLEVATTAVASASAAVPWAESKRGSGRGAAAQADRKRRDELTQGYRRVLTALGSGGGGDFAARNALLELEGGSLLAGDVADLALIEIEIADWLAAREPEALVPVMELHAALYRVYRDRRRFALVVHSRDRVEALAALYATHAKSTGAQVIAGRALASLAGYVQAANLPASSRRLYAQTLALDSTNEAAALGLASSYERYGDYPEAVATLQKLLAVRPGQVEARLRLAVNLFRTGRNDQARRELDALLATPEGGWVRALAVQEAARHRIESGDVAGAVGLLEAEVARGEPEATTLVLLAHLYDRQGNPRRSIDLLEQVRPVVAAGPSSRKLYDSWPDAALGSMRRDLAAATESRAALLAAAFSAGETAPSNGSQVGGR